MPVTNTAEQEAAARKVIQQTEAANILVTRGPAGMLLVPKDGRAIEFAARAREVFEVSGAGDTAASALAAALGSHCAMTDAIAIANIAAGIVVGKIGTAVVNRSEIVHEIEHQSALIASDKLLQSDEANERAGMWRRMGLKIGFISGVFDSVTPADLNLLEKARGECDRLIVAVHGDAVMFQAGYPKSSQDQNTRAYVLASMVFSDAVVICDDETPQRLLAGLEPDMVLTKPENVQQQEIK